MGNQYNIVNQLGVVDMWVKHPSDPNKIEILFDTEIQMFDLIGVLVEIPADPNTEGSVPRIAFFPWGSVLLLSPVPPKAEAPAENPEE